MTALRRDSSGNALSSDMDETGSETSPLNSPSADGTAPTPSAADRDRDPHTPSSLAAHAPSASDISDSTTPYAAPAVTSQPSSQSAAALAVQAVGTAITAVGTPPQPIPKTTENQTLLPDGHSSDR